MTKRAYQVNAKIGDGSWKDFVVITSEISKIEDAIKQISPDEDVLIENVNILSAKLIII